jgi:RHS repeat-associated protein
VQTGTISGGGTNTVVSQVDTVYGSCGCAPLGKMMQQSLPHAPGGTVYYTTNTYDGIGRTLSVIKPDGASTTTYSYAGNTVTTTDPAGKWKTFTMDAFGNVTQVVEPNPAGGANYVTTYTYDLFNHLVKVTMPRPYGSGTYTQTRTFLYNGNDLMQVTNPENGTVTYTYDTNHRVTSKLDAKGQKAVYTYDSLGRKTEDQHFKQVSGSWVEDTTQQVLYYYDSNPLVYGYSNNVAGRLAAVSYQGLGGTVGESYNYDVAGNVIGKSVSINPTPWTTQTLAASWTYDDQGRLLSVTYPSWKYLTYTAPGSVFYYGYDTLGRLNTMGSFTYPGNDLISGVTYGVANQVTAITGPLFNETRSYNTMFQLTQITVPGVLNVQYGYSSTQNNGKITSQTDVISGETVVYTYDALNRLATAQTSAGSPTWGQSYTYDGWGNLTDQTVILGSAPSLHVAYNPANNRQTGDVADANGNIGSGYTYDMSNRLIQASGTSMVYAYAPDNKRVWRSDSSSINEYTFWAPNGQKLGSYSYNGTILTLSTEYVYFGSRMIARGTAGYGGGGNDSSGDVYIASVATDRLGSIGKFYPFGQEKPSATMNDTEKFTGYYRDAATGLDYAVNRYHQPGVGRFMTADPAASSAKVNDPGSWNRYAYTVGDPVNRIDRKGTDFEADTCGGLGFLDIDPCDDAWDWYGPSDETAAADYACNAGSGYGSGYMELIGSNWQCVSQNPETIAPPPPLCPLIGILGSYTTAAGSPVYAEFSPEMAVDIDEALFALNSEGITPQISSGYRGSAAQGGIPRGRGFPVAKAGQSWHNVGEAVDIQLNANSSTGQAIIAAMEGAGLTWGGVFGDSVHFQLPSAITLADGTVHSGAPSPNQVANCEAEHPNGH